MAGTVGIDFGTCNSVIAVWDPGQCTGFVPVLSEVSRELRYRIGDEWHTVHVVPSLIAYEGQRVYIGQQVYTHGLEEAPETFRWMKAFISAQQPMPRKVAGAERCRLQVSQRTCRDCAARDQGGRLCNFVAGRDFLSRMILYAADHCNLAEDELVFTAPVEMFEHYGDWISEVCEAVGVRRYRLLDEPTACVLGYEGPLQKDQVFGVLDFGGGTVDIAIVKIDLESPEGRKCTVLGKAGAPLGGRNVTQWLYDDFLRRCGAAPHTVGCLGTQIMLEVEAAKEQLSFDDKASLNIVDYKTGKLYAADYTRSDLEDILRKNSLFDRLSEVLRAALKDAEEKADLRERNISQFLLVGGSTLIPAVRSAFAFLFGERLAYHRPFTSVALGACRYAAGVGDELLPWIQHDYAIRHYNPNTETYEFETIVRRGTPYPSSEPVARLSVAGIYDNQTELGVDIYELGDSRSGTSGQITVFDENGQPRLIKARDSGHHFWINEHQRTFLYADPPASKDEHRFDLTFTLDGNKRLLMTAYDRRTGRLLFQNHPVAKLK